MLFALNFIKVDNRRFWLPVILSQKPGESHPKCEFTTISCLAITEKRFSISSRLHLLFRELAIICKGKVGFWVLIVIVWCGILRERGKHKTPTDPPLSITSRFYFICGNESYIKIFRADIWCWCWNSEINKRYVESFYLCCMPWGHKSGSRKARKGFRWLSPSSESVIMLILFDDVIIWWCGVEELVERGM